MPFLIALVACYVIGAIPSGVLLVWWSKGLDVRSVGSGNIGATNVARAAGLRMGVLVFLVDALKGIMSVTIVAPSIWPGSGSAGILACGFAAVIGHIFPVFLRFRGGKGVATTMGVIFGTAPGIGLACLIVWAIVFGVWRYVSVASMALTVAIPIVQVMAGSRLMDVVLGSAICLLIVARHKDNIQRLLAGREPKVGRKQAH